MAAKRGRKSRVPAVDSRLLTGLTHGELATLKEELDNLLSDLNVLMFTPESLMERLKQEERCIHVPAKVFEKLRRLVKTLQRPWPQAKIKQYRWSLVRRFLDCPQVRLTYEEACKWASEVCEDTPAKAGPRMMGRDYRDMEKKLPKEERRPRIYGGKPHPTPADRKCRDARGPKQRLEALQALIKEVGGEHAEILTQHLVKDLKGGTLPDLVSIRFDEVVAGLRSRRDHPSIIIIAAPD